MVILKLNSIIYYWIFIWVTFDENSTDNVLGFDILQKLSFYFSNNDKKMRIFKSYKDMQDYMIVDKSTKDIAAAFRGSYGKEESWLCIILVFIIRKKIYLE